MTEYNDAVLIGQDEICRFMRLGRTKVDGLRRRYADLPIVQESPRSLWMADREALREWQRRYSRGEALLRKEAQSARGQGFSQP
jgi:hypothetical protein